MFRFFTIVAAIALALFVSVSAASPNGGTSPMQGTPMVPCGGDCGGSGGSGGGRCYGVKDSNGQYTGYDYAGKSKAAIPSVGGHLSAQILESGSYLASGDNGHVADWVGVDNGAATRANLRWIQAGVSIFPGNSGTLPYAYVEAKYGPNSTDYYFNYVYAPDGPSYGARVGRTGTNTWNASIDGLAVTENFTSTMTESYFGTEMLASPVGAPCNNLSFQTSSVYPWAPSTGMFSVLSAPSIYNLSVVTSTSFYASGG